MFDIGFWELVMIAVVTLLVVGPDEFPAVVRKLGAWIADARRYTAAVKSEFNAEIRKAEELKELIAKEAQVAELHKIIDETKTVIPVNYTPAVKAPPLSAAGAEQPPAPAAPAPAPGTPPPAEKGD